VGHRHHRHRPRAGTALADQVAAALDPAAPLAARQIMGQLAAAAPAAAADVDTRVSVTFDPTVSRRRCPGCRRRRRGRRMLHGLESALGPAG